ncbi:MAG: type II toxin-antitoxin system RelE/ParE family toxin [Planctomycetes bacterium]|nr:type II toxin-antitoxin system RelE/ParE family toxin [Planctomycetota bacterium]
MAVAFMEELDHAARKILESPGLWPPYLFRTRRYLFRRFPFMVIYRKERGRILVIAIAHGKRKPGYWRGR